MTRTPEEIRAELAENGLSLAAWARRYGFSEALTYRVMRGHPAKLGQSHRIAVALGLKEGRLAGLHELSFPISKETAARDERVSQVRDQRGTKTKP
tara:strand:- start:10943 stop:11230 length:288 start_codon:yes stop_codon:yes gene_type:complete